MRVAVYQVTSSYAIGGCESYTWNLCRYLTARGHECDLIAGLTDRPRQPYPEVRLRMARFIARERVPDLGSRFRKLVERLSFGWHARQLLLAGRYDILNIHKPYDIPAALWFRRETGCRIVWRCHGTDFYPGLGRLIDRVDAIYCVSNYARDILRANYPVHPAVIYTGVDTQFFSPAATGARAAAASPILVYFGRFEGWKGVRYLIDALGELRGLPWSARLVGEGPERDNLLRQIHALGLAERVRVEPAMGRQQIRELLAQSDIAVFPAVGVETFSNAVLEAMSMEAAIVVTRVGGLTEAVDDGVTGLSVAPRSGSDLASAIRRLLVDPSLRARLGKAARARALAQFDALKSFNQVEALFDRVARGAAPGAAAADEGACEHRV